MVQVSLSLTIDLLLGIQSLLIFLFAGYEYRTLMHFPTLPEQTGTGSNVPLVSIILPVRNQARTVSDCVSSLVGLEYPNREIIVVDGGSTDGTRELVQKFVPEITIVDEDPLPVGWVGKNWACHLGYKKSRGELLLFTDGDSFHATDSLARSVNYLRSEKADLVTLAPGTILRSFWERLLQPPIFLLIMILVGGKLVNDDNRQNAIGNGQYMLFRREAYEKIGGHYAVRDKIIEDYSLGRLLKRAGMRLRFVTASDALGVRMYASLGEIWRGWRKNFYTVSERHMLPRAVTRIFLMFTFLVMPFAVLGYGILLAAATPLNVYLIAALFMSGLLWLGMVMLDSSLGVSSLSALILQLALLVYIFLAIVSIVRRSLAYGFSWKGRVYGKPIERQLEPRSS